jgi:hypothetical protein
MVSIASCQTSASPQPPPIVPLKVPSGRSSIDAPAFLGVDPRVEDTVASTRGSPLCIASLISR